MIEQAFATGVADVAPGITRVALPVGVNDIETVNSYLIEDGDDLTIVDCGLWRPEPDDQGLRALETALNEHGYVLADISRVIVTHAHIDHYGLTGRLMELSGAELWMHQTTDLDCEKYRHPETAELRRRDMLADHGVPESELPLVAASLKTWLPYLHSVVEASRRLQGGEEFTVGSRTMQVLHTPGHSLGHVCLWSPSDGLLFSGDHVLGGVTPPVTFERGFDANPLESYLNALTLVRDLHPTLVLPGHGRAFAEGSRRVNAILRSKQRRLDQIRTMIETRPCTVTEIADKLVATAIVPHQRNMALTETLANIACLRYRGLVERRVRKDGVYEWYATG